MIQKDVPLKEYTSFKIGGNAKYFLEVSAKEELISGLKEWKKISTDFPEEEKRIFVLGGGSNLLVSDNGFAGLVIHPNINFINNTDNIVTVGCGVLIPDFINFCIDNSLSGFEWAGGLPGTIGGAVRGNAGAFGGETKDSVFEVESLDIDTFEIKKRKNAQCDFDYRDSIFKTGEGKNEIILSVSFNFKTGNREEIKKTVEEKMDYRKTKHPLVYPSAGSVFKNVPVEKISSSVLEEFESHIKKDPFPVIPVATILSSVNLKGKKIGGAQISENHPNFIVNVENATSQDVKDLISLEQKTVKEKYGIGLEPEIMLVE